MAIPPQLSADFKQAQVDAGGSTTLPFPWLDYHPQGMVSAADAQLGPDGCTVAMVMLIQWQDLNTAVQYLLGYSWREMINGVPTLRRQLPWQHPRWNQLYVKSISSIKGIQLQGVTKQALLGGGEGNKIVPFSPDTVWTLAQLTLHFWRPPYAVRADDDVATYQDSYGVTRPMEWLRFVDRHWELETEMLSREGQQFIWSGYSHAGIQGISGNPFQGSVGQPIAKLRLKRTWYQVPEACLFTLNANDGTPSGVPYGLIYSQTNPSSPAVNPITGASYAGAQPTYLDNGSNLPATLGTPLPGTVNLPVGGGVVVPSPPAGGPYVNETDAAHQFLGCPMGTLLYLGADLKPVSLQLPPELMGPVPVFGASEPISQVQYDVTFHFVYFDPPRASTVPSQWRGHNLAPFSGNGQWYAIQGQLGVDGKTPAAYPGNPALTPYGWSDFSDLFKIL